jgi:hypothetical protein
MATVTAWMGGRPRSALIGVGQRRDRPVEHGHHLRQGSKLRWLNVDHREPLPRAFASRSGTSRRRVAPS